MNNLQFSPLIGIVGVCASGKSTLIRGLTILGYSCRHIAQEHSYVQDMWQRLTHPHILVYLHVSYEITLQRKHLNWTKKEYDEQYQRLQHARNHADILINTDSFSPEALVDYAREKIDLLLSNPGTDFS